MKASIKTSHGASADCCLADEDEGAALSNASHNPLAVCVSEPPGIPADTTKILLASTTCNRLKAIRNLFLILACHW